MLTVMGIVSALINALIVAAVVRRLLGVPVGWPRTLVLSLFGGAIATPVLEWAFPRLGAVAPSQGGGAVPATVGLTFLFIGWLLAVEISLLAIAEAIVPTGSVPGPWELLRSLPGRVRRTRRYLAILAIAAKHGLLGRLRGARGSGRPHDTPAALAAALTDGGVTFVKLGQMLATRADLVPPRYATELSRLHSEVPPEPWETVRATLRAELGDLDAHFTHIDPEPLAAASVGQVHCAQLPTGEQVVVKVQRSDAAEVVHKDLDIVARLARTAERRAGWARSLGAVDLAHGFARSLDEELDYSIERANLASMHGTDDVIVPRVFAHCSTRRVLTMSAIDGVPLSRAASEIGRLDESQRAELAAALLDVVLRQMLVDGVFHADLHGGNVLLLGGERPRLALLDFGAVGRLDRNARSAFLVMLSAIDRQDGAGAARALTHLLEAPDDMDWRPLERRMADLIMRVGAVGVTALVNDMMSMVMAAGLRVPVNVAAAFRALGALEGTLRLLDPDLDVITLARQRAREVVHADLDLDAARAELRTQVVTALPGLQRLPDQIASISTRLDRPNFGIGPSMVADAGVRRFVAGLVQQVVLAVLTATSAACGIALALSQAGPMMTSRLRLTTYAGMVMLLFAYVLGSRLVVVAFRTRYETETAER